MTSRAKIAALRDETEDLLTAFDQDSPEHANKAVALIDDSRLALSVARDDGLGPWESPELEYAFHIASRHGLHRLALLCAFEVLVLGEKSLGALGTAGDHGFLTFLA